MGVLLLPGLLLCVVVVIRVTVVVEVMDIPQEESPNANVASANACAVRPAVFPSQELLICSTIQMPDSVERLHARLPLLADELVDKLRAQ